MTDVPLFGGYDDPPEPEPVEVLSAGQRLTRRQQQDVSNGKHPLTGGPLHPAASAMRSPQSGSRDPFTCGTCVFRDPTGYPKCALPNPSTGRPWPTRVSHSARSDVRAWWPACGDYVAADPEHLLDTNRWPSVCSCGETFETGAWWRLRLAHVEHVAQNAKA